MSGEQNLELAAETSVPSAGPGRPADDAFIDYEPYEGRSGWRPLPALGISAVVLAVAMVVFAIAGFALMHGATRLGLPKDKGVLMLAMLATQTVIVVGAVFAARAKGGSAVVALSLKAPRQGWKAYVAGLAALFVAVTGYGLFTSYALKQSSTQDLGQMLEIVRGPWWPVSLVVIGAGAPLSEELLFRGFLQSSLTRSRIGYWGAAVVTTSLWTLLHYGYSSAGMGEVFLIGLVFAVLLRRTGSLRVTMACHAIYNSVLAMALIFGPKDMLLGN